MSPPSKFSRKNGKNRQSHPNDGIHLKPLGINGVICDALGDLSEIFAIFLMILAKIWPINHPEEYRIP